MCIDKYAENESFENNMLLLHLGTSSIDGCSCLEPCSGVTNDIAFSSAALSSLSVDSLLKSDIEELRLKYHRALELKYVSQVFFQLS